MLYLIKSVAISFLLVFSVSSYCQSPNSFNQAKKIAAQVFVDHTQTLYCQCTFDGQQGINLKSCGMQSAENIKRAHKMEWEHMMAAENFGKHFQCWRTSMCEKNGKPYKGRRCCQKIDAQFRHIEAELYNLWPAVGLVNQARSNYRFGLLPDKLDFYGCAFAVNKQSRRAEPPDGAKGIVARANLFIADHYGIRISNAQRQLLNVWNKQYPPDSWETEWAKRVAVIEGYENPYIHNYSNFARNS